MTCPTNSRSAQKSKPAGSPAGELCYRWERLLLGVLCYDVLTLSRWLVRVSVTLSDKLPTYRAAVYNFFVSHCRLLSRTVQSVGCDSEWFPLASVLMAPWPVGAIYPPLGTENSLQILVDRGTLQVGLSICVRYPTYRIPCLPSTANRRQFHFGGSSVNLQAFSFPSLLPQKTGGDRVLCD